tara:strand:+ start:1681 stop:2037 length:357 start_codon:yes stop_codon:yes gene_type:complete
MSKVSLVDIKPDPQKLLSTLSGDSSNNMLVGLKRFKEILDGIKLLMAEAKSLQKPAQTEDVLQDRPTPPANSGLTKEQLASFISQFADNLIKQGYGDKTIIEVLKEVPLTIKQLKGLL